MADGYNKSPNGTGSGHGSGNNANSSGSRPLAVVTGASSGIGFQLAQLCALHGYDLVVASDTPKIKDAAQHFVKLGAHVRAVQADLSAEHGVDELYNAVKEMNRPIEVLCANAGRGLGHAFLDQDFEEVKKVIGTNITGTIYLLQKVARDMCERDRGRILITGSIAGFIPGTYQAVYNGTKAFIDSFAYALRHEIMVKTKNVTVTTLMPGATDTEFFKTADMTDTPIGQAQKDPPLDVAMTGFNAMMRGQGSVVHGLKNKLQSVAGAILPQGLMAEAHRKMAQPDGARKRATNKTGLGSYTDRDIEKVSIEGDGSFDTPGNSANAGPAKVQSDLDRYRDQMADNAPASGTKDDRN